MPQCSRKILSHGDWLPVVFSCECDEDGNCPCGVDYAEECACPGPTMDEFEYMERGGILYGRKIDDPSKIKDTGID